jgi:hypothetical protein
MLRQNLGRYLGQSLGKFVITESGRFCKVCRNNRERRRGNRTESLKEQKDETKTKVIKNEI